MFLSFLETFMCDIWHCSLTDILKVEHILLQNILFAWQRNSAWDSFSDTCKGSKVTHSVYEVPTLHVFCHASSDER